MNIVTVCKNVIASNNKRGWRKPDPAIRIARRKNGKATDHAHDIAIKDRRGNIVALILSSQDGKPLVKCGAKVAIFTEYPVMKLVRGRKR